MFCKWCGETIDAVTSRCPKCGRDTPPMSDCGGLYKLKTGAEGSAAPQPSGPVRLPQLDKLCKMYARDASQNRVMQVVTLGVMLIAIVLLVATLISVISVGAKLNNVENDDGSQIQHEQGPVGQEDDDSTVGENGATVPSDAAQGEQEPDQPGSVEQAPATLSDQAMEINVRLFKSDYEKIVRTYVSESVDLGEYTGKVTSWMNTRSNVGTSIHWTNVWYTLGSDSEVVHLIIDDKFADDQFDMHLEWEFRGTVMSAFAVSDVTWEYRVDSDGGDWSALGDDEDTLSTATKSGISIASDKIENLLEGTDSMEVRCVLRLAHADGGTMTVTVEGIVIDAEGFVIEDDMPPAKKSGATSSTTSSIM